MIGYRAFGLVVRSSVPLPGPAALDTDPPDCIFEVRPDPIGDRPVGRRYAIRLPGGKISWTVGRCRSGYLVRFPGLADFLLVDDGREVTCAPRRGTPVETIAHLFLAQVMPLALSRQGRLVLHASAVVTPRGAIAFLGASGWGKSTLSASFARRSFPLLADDGLLLFEDGAVVVAVPSYPEVGLWPDALAALGSGGDGCDVFNRAGKQRLNVDSGPWPFSREPVALRHLYVLSDPKPADPSPSVVITTLGRRDAFIELVRNTYRLHFDDPARLRGEFESIARVARHCVLSRLSVPRDLARLPEVQAAILEHLDHCETRDRDPSGA